MRYKYLFYISLFLNKKIDQKLSKSNVKAIYLMSLVKVYNHKFLIWLDTCTVKKIYKF